jgi:dihydrolipoamide dehydrogenase
MSATAENTFDIVILGGGSGGYACALRAAELGLSVALIEKGKLGGTCLHMGCIPTKALLHAAEVADTAREGMAFGVKTTFESVDMGGVNAYKDGVVGRLYKGLQGLVKSKSIEYVEGVGHLVAKNTIEVGGRQALFLDYVPNRVVVLGGGVIGVEFASVFKSFGSEVTIIEALPRLVALEDEAISKQLERSFRKRKINFKTNVKFSGVTQSGDVVSVALESGETIEADLLLVAVGRGPVTAGLGYEEAGVTVDRGFVLANERCQTNVDGIYAVGDIVPGLQLAHRGFAQGIFVAEQIAGLNPPVIDEMGIPRVTYCDPEIASIGYTEAQAKEKFGEIETYDYSLGGNGKSQILQTTGFVKLVRQKDGPVVGVHMIGARMGEQVGEAQLIYNWEALPSDVAQLIHAHPTQNEALGEAHLALAGKPLHAHG